MTVSEISVVGLAAIFIPYPHKDQQQHRNAKDLELIGAAKIIDQLYFNTTLLINLINSLNRNKLLFMAKTGLFPWNSRFNVKYFSCNR